jgi:hypothetical protein
MNPVLVGLHILSPIVAEKYVFYGNDTARYDFCSQSPNDLRIDNSKLSVADLRITQQYVNSPVGEVLIDVTTIYTPIYSLYRYIYYILSLKRFTCSDSASCF